MTEFEAWREIGNRLLTPDYTPETRAGHLCAEVCRLKDELAIDAEARAAMCTRAMHHVYARGRSLLAYNNWFGEDSDMTDQDCREARAMAAYWMALEAEAGE